MLMDYFPIKVRRSFTEQEACSKAGFLGNIPFTNQPIFY